MWEEYAAQVYPHDDLVVSLRGRCVLDTLREALQRRPDLALVVCGAGFSSYPWLLPVPVAVEVDLPHIVEAKQRRAAELGAAGLLPAREVEFLAADLIDPGERQEVVERVRKVAAGRPLAFVAEGLVFYLPAAAAAKVVALGRELSPEAVSLVSYWPSEAVDHPVLAAQRGWFRRRGVPEEATHLSPAEMSALLGGAVEHLDPEQQQRRYLGEVQVPEIDLVPEHVAVAGR
jgi:O-methyltransferase involved in polyketide biosynthesis